MRHVPQGTKWHKASDHLRGTDVYGDPSVGAAAAGAEWSIKFADTEFDQFLFATGDHTKWMVVDRDTLWSTRGDNVGLKVLSSSATSAPHVVRIYSEEKWKHEPWVSLYSGDAAFRNNGEGFLYGGNSWDVDGVGGHTDQVESESGRPFGTVNLASHGGANVFIRLAKKHRMSADHDSLGMSLQRSFLRAATAAGGSRPGTPPSSSSLATTQLAAAALSRIADRAEGRDDASLMLLWASYPRIFFYNLVRCSFYRNRIYEWMKGKVSHLKKRNVDMVFFASE